MSYVQAVQAVLSAEADRGARAPAPAIAQASPITPAADETTSQILPQLRVNTTNKRVDEEAANSSQHPSSPKTDIPTQPFAQPSSPSPHESDSRAEPPATKEAAKPLQSNLTPVDKHDVTSRPSSPNRQQEPAEGPADANTLEDPTGNNVATFKGHDVSPSDEAQKLVRPAPTRTGICQSTPSCL
jgi:hypothetical protein